VGAEEKNESKKEISDMHEGNFSYSNLTINGK
jgi:hypothetical protein